jgi:hypothetical protein
MNSRKPIHLPVSPALVELSRLEMQANRFKSKICDILREYGCNDTPREDALPYLMTIQNVADISEQSILQKALIVSMLQNEYMSIVDYLERIAEMKDQELLFEEKKKEILKTQPLHELSRSRAVTAEDWFECDTECPPVELGDELSLNRSIIKEQIKSLSQYAVKNKIDNENHHVIKDIERLQDHLTNLC